MYLLAVIVFLSSFLIFAHSNQRSTFDVTFNPVQPTHHSSSPDGPQLWEACDWESGIASVAESWHQLVILRTEVLS
ncbi:hypothetical protein OF83DRAFT_1152753, partial [Amylostereum chailletii]